MAQGHVSVLPKRDDGAAKRRRGAPAGGLAAAGPKWGPGAKLMVGI